MSRRSGGRRGLGTVGDARSRAVAASRRRRVAVVAAVPALALAPGASRSAIVRTRVASCGARARDDASGDTAIPEAVPGDADDDDDDDSTGRDAGGRIVVVLGAGCVWGRRTRTRRMSTRRWRWRWRWITPPWTTRAMPWTRWGRGRCCRLAAAMIAASLDGVSPSPSALASPAFAAGDPRLLRRAERRPARSARLRPRRGLRVRGGRGVRGAGAPRASLAAAVDVSPTCDGAGAFSAVGGMSRRFNRA